MSRRILITVPNLLRDLEACALVGFHLERCFGHDVRFTTGRNLSADLVAQAPDVLVLDQIAWDYRSRQASLAKRLGCRLVILPTSGLFQDLRQHALIAGKAFGATRLVDLYLAWGEEARRSLLEDGLGEDQTRTTGSPRFDFYTDPYTSLVRDRSDFLRSIGIDEVGRPVVVWAPGNVAYAATGGRALDRWAQGTRVDPKVFREEMADTIAQYDEHSPWIVEIARRQPSWTVIVKVHPGDDLSRFLWMREGASNLHVVQNVPIRELLCHMDVMLQWCSTAANEAWMLGKPVLSLSTRQPALKIGTEYLAGSQTTRSVEETLAAAARWIADPRIPDSQARARAAFLEKTYYRIDGRSSERCAQAIDEIASPPRHTDANQQAIRVAAERARADIDRRDIVRATDRLKAMVGIPPSRSLRFWKRPTERDQQRAIEAKQKIRVQDLYAQFESVHREPCPRADRRPSRDGAAPVEVV